MKPTTTSSSPTSRLISRRRVVTSLGLLTIAGAGTGFLRAVVTNSDVPAEVVGRRTPGFHATRWRDPGSWSDGRVPGPDDIAVITRPVVIEGDVKVAGVRIEPRGALVFSPHHATMLESAGNVVVAGQLVMRPITADVSHTLRFAGIDESKFQGGGHDVMDSDIGLWVIDNGLLDAQGATRTGWLRLGGDALAGDSVLRLARVPEGWRPGDLLTIAPSAPGDFSGFEERRIASITGDHVTLDARLDRDHTGLYHPELSTALTAEVANLTRNVQIGGTPQGRAHVVFTHALMAQTIRHVGIQHVGPPRRNGDIILGRYGLHFHMCKDGTRGTELEGVVIRDCGNRGYVAHGSNGITLRDCVAYNLAEEAFWWDRDTRSTFPENAGADILYEHCAAMKVVPGTSGWNVSTGHSHTAFELGQGEGNQCVDSVAVGVVAGASASGFHWPANANQMPNQWLFEGCVSHNNDSNGIFVWQNGSTQGHIIDKYVGYRNRQAGIEHGAYGNSYRYRDSLLVENGQLSKSKGSQLIQHAQASWNTRSQTPSGYERVIFDAGDQSRACVVTKKTNGGFADQPLEYLDCHFLNASYVLELDEKSGSTDSSHFELHFVRSVVGPDGRDMEPSDILVTRSENGTIVRVQRRDGTAWQRDANGKVTVIPAFYQS